MTRQATMQRWAENGRVIIPMPSAKPRIAWPDVAVVGIALLSIVLLAATTTWLNSRHAHAVEGVWRDAMRHGYAVKEFTKEAPHGVYRFKNRWELE